MRTLTQSSLSTEYVLTRVVAIVDGAVVDPTADNVEMAFTQPGVDPDVGDWNAAEWETDPSGPKYFARLLVGPGAGGLDLGKGTFAVWVRATDNPEIPVRRAGVLVLV